MKCPCYECTKRHPVCHDACTDYIAWCEARKQKKEKARSGEQEIAIYEIQRSYRMRNRYGK